MSYPEGDPRHCSLCMQRQVERAKAAFDALTPEQQSAHRREQAIDFAWGNLQASTNHKVDRAVVEREYDRMHP